MQYGILIDTTMCVGCYQCEDACAERWGFEKTEVHALSATKNTAVMTVNDTFVPKMCMHCEDPTCVSVCPVGAFRKQGDGAVTYDIDRCIGCRYCIQACPFDVPRYQWGSANPAVTKCDRCHDRVSKGEQPACVAICPAGARVFGKLEDMIEEAKKRLRDNPSTYHQHIYGLEEAGGTSTLYLASKSFDQLGLRMGLPNQPLPNYTEAIMSKVPGYVGWVSTLLGGVWWITKRRKEVSAFEKSLRDLEKRNPSGSNSNGNHKTNNGKKEN